MDVVISTVQSSTDKPCNPTLSTNTQVKTIFQQSLHCTSEFIATFMKNRGIDISQAIWCAAYLMWAYSGVIPPYGVLGAGYNLAWEVYFSINSCFECECDLPPESNFATRWMTLVGELVTDTLMLAALFNGGHRTFVIHTLIHATIWAACFMIALYLAGERRKHVWFFAKYGAYPVELAYTSLCFYEWIIGTEQPVSIMIMIVFSMIPAVLRTIQRSKLGNLWIRFSQVMLCSHVVMLLTMCVSEVFAYERTTWNERIMY